MRTLIWKLDLLGYFFRVFLFLLLDLLSREVYGCC